MDMIRIVILRFLLSFISHSAASLTGVNETWSIYLRFKFMFDDKPEADAQ